MRDRGQGLTGRHRRHSGHGCTNKSPRAHNSVSTKTNGHAGDRQAARARRLTTLSTIPCAQTLCPAHERGFAPPAVAVGALGFAASIGGASAVGLCHFISASALLFALA